MILSPVMLEVMKCDIFPIASTSPFTFDGDIRDRLEQQGVVDLPELRLAVFQDGNNVSERFPAPELHHVIINVGYNFPKIVGIRPSLLRNPIHQVTLHAREINARPAHRRGDFFKEYCIRAHALRLVCDPAHYVVADARIDDLDDVGNDVVHRMNKISAAASGAFDRVLLVGKSALRAALPLRHGAIERNVMLPPLAPFLAGFFRDQSSSNEPRFLELVLEHIKPLCRIVERRILLLQLCRAPVHECRGVLAVICKYAHSFRQPLRPMPYHKILAKRPVFGLVLQVDPLQCRFQSRPHILSIRICQISRDDLPGHCVRIGSVCR